MNTMNEEATVTYRGRTFEVAAVWTELDGAPQWTEAVAELMPDGTRAEWDGSGISYGNPAKCLTEAIGDVIDTVDDDEDDTAYLEIVTNADANGRT